MCSSLFHRNRYKSSKRRIIFLFDTTSSPKRATISKRTFELLSIFSSLFFPPSIFHSILYRCTDWNGTKSNQARKGGDFLFFNRISVISIAYRQGSNQLEKKSHASTSFHRDSCSFHQVRIDYSLILYNALSIFICFHLQNFYTICTSFFPCDSNLFPISLSFNIYIYI